MTHRIPEDLSNSQIIHLIDEFVRFRRDREMLKDHWFEGLSLMALADKYELSLTAVKSIIYTQGDRILLMAAKR